MIKLIDIFKELQVNNPNIPNTQEATKLAIKLVNTHKNIDWGDENITYETPIDKVNPRLVRFLLSKDKEDDFRFQMLNDKGKNIVVAMYVSEYSNDVVFEIMEL